MSVLILDWHMNPKGLNDSSKETEIVSKGVSLCEHLLPGTDRDCE